MKWPDFVKSAMDADIYCGVRAAIFRASSILEVTAPVLVSAIWFMMAIIAATAMAWKNAARDREKSENAEQEKKWFHMCIVE
jgi:hypothetical protein